MMIQENFLRKVFSRITAHGLVKAIGIYSILVISLISSLVLISDAPVHEKAIIKMAVGLILIWIIEAGQHLKLFFEIIGTSASFAG